MRVEDSQQAADEWRYRDHEPDEIPARIVGDVRVDTKETLRRKDLRDFVAETHGDRVAYHLAGRVSPVFVDRGDRIDVHDADEAAILTTLQLGAKKWGAFQVAGSKAYEDRWAPSGCSLRLHDHESGAAGRHTRGIRPSGCPAGPGRRPNRAAGRRPAEAAAPPVVVMARVDSEG